jgi:hypothetical protein
VSVASESPQSGRRLQQKGAGVASQKKKMHGARKHSQNRTACKNQKKLAHFLAQKETSFYSIKSKT